jgi:hypothetical protein
MLLSPGIFRSRVGLFCYLTILRSRIRGPYGRPEHEGATIAEVVPANRSSLRDARWQATAETHKPRHLVLRRRMPFTQLTSVIMGALLAASLKLRHPILDVDALQGRRLLFSATPSRSRTTVRPRHFRICPRRKQPRREASDAPAASSAKQKAHARSAKVKPILRSFAQRDARRERLKFPPLESPGPNA